MVMVAVLMSVPPVGKSLEPPIRSDQYSYHGFAKSREQFNGRLKCQWEATNKAPPFCLVRYSQVRWLDISTNASCTVNCVPYCPQKLLHSVYHGSAMLSLGDFGRVLSNTPTDVRIDFSGFTEPFLNPEAVDMIELAHDRGYGVSLISTLVGLKPSDVDRLAKVDPLGFVVHLPDPCGIAHIPITDEYKEVLALTLTKIQLSDFTVMNNYFRDHYWAGNSENSPSFHFKGPFFCSKLSGPHFSMLPDGTTVLCAMDRGLRHVLGNLMETSYDSLRESETYRRIWRSRHAWDGDELCRSCRWAVTTSQMTGKIGRTLRELRDLL
jgi:hypothetical protein